MIVVELFSGPNRSFSTVCEGFGHDTFCIEFDKRFECDLHADIMHVEPYMLPARFRTPDVVWASPPCKGFSVCTIGRYWRKVGDTGVPKHPVSIASHALLRRTFWLIMELNPAAFIIENPMGMMRKVLPASVLPRFEVTYCQYLQHLPPEERHMKPTDLFSSLTTWTPRPKCKPGDKCHAPAPRGSKTGTQGKKDWLERSKVPDALCLEVMRACEKQVAMVEG